MGVPVPYHEQLLEQANTLLALDPKRPYQANVRRAASASYYAVFHFFADELAKQVVGASAASDSLGFAVGRALEHGCLRSASERFSSQNAPNNLPVPLRSCLTSVSPVFRALASDIVSLQDLRHRADYDRAIHLQKREANVAVSKAKSLIKDWQKLDADERSTFLVAILLWKSLAGR
jgi:uncharacterized protein (UPF0332 family)